MASLLLRVPYVRFGSGSRQELVDCLYEAIPQEAEDRLIRIHSGTMINGGTSRGWNDIDGAVCTYNNTIGSKEEIVAWYKRAYEIAAQRKEVPGEEIDF